MGKILSFEPQDSSQIIQLLLQMETYNQGHAAPLPMEENIKSVWSGIGFRIAQYRFIAPIEYVSEIMKYPSVSLVPGSKDWVKGIANIRGNLLPIFDLQGFLGELTTPIKRETRILAIAKDELTAGLIVDEIFGMKYFAQEHFDGRIGRDEQWQEYFSGGYKLDGENWIVFNLKSLVENKDFLNVAI